MADPTGPDPDAVDWYTADPRAIFPIAPNDPAGAFRLPKRFDRKRRNHPRHITADRAFARVVAACAEPRSDDDPTWINPAIADVFQRAHDAGHAHSIEVWDPDDPDRLIGGLYGLALGGAFFAESMCSRVPDGSKHALAWLVNKLRADGFTLLDVQFTNPHLTQFGVAEIPATDYANRLHRALNSGTTWSPA